MILDYGDNNAYIDVAVALKRWSSVRIRIAEEPKRIIGVSSIIISGTGFILRYIGQMKALIWQ
jgi:hypothetical protein